MFLNQMILDGFKSYAQRTVLTGFDKHFNAITGLNGSGKSNILDAICFVLGISNLSQVRVANLQELVYKQGQAGVTKASVSLVFDNTEKKNSPIGYEQYEEVTITRQVVIGGKNKYLINGRSAQASQVQTLFESVQLNIKNPHFLIMQGRITKVLNMKPPEILGMIEEACGTRMFEDRKQKALNTIEKKQLKVNEIVSILNNEITPTLDRLRGERSHYLKWAANNTEEERLIRFCVAYEYFEAEGKLNTGSEEFQILEAGLAKVEATRKEASDALSKTEEETTRVQGLRNATDVANATEVREALSKELVKIGTECANQEKAKDAEVANLEAIKKSEEESGVQVADKEAAIAEQLKAIEAAEVGAKKAEEEHANLQKEYQDMCAGVATDKEDSRTLTDQIAALSAEVTASNARVKQGAARIKHLKATAKTTEKEMKAAEKQVSQLVKDRNAAEARVKAAEEGLQRLNYDQTQEDGLAEEREREEHTVANLRVARDTLSAQMAGRLNFDYSDPERGFDRSRVKGLVANLINVKDIAHTTALEVTAGGRLFQVVVDTEQTAKILLKNGRLKKRVTIIPLNKISGYPLRSSQLSRAAAIAQRTNGQAMCAIELVGFEHELRDAITYVFGSTIVCDSLETAKQVAFDKGVRTRTVTLQGDSIEPQGTLTGGSTGKLGATLAKLGELQATCRDLGVHEERLRVVTQKIQSLSAASKKFSELSREVELKRNELSVLAERLGQSSHSQLEAQLAETNARLQEEVAAVETAKTGGAAAAEKNEQLKAEEASFRQAREQLLKKLEGKMKAAKAALSAAAAALKGEERASQVLKMELEQLTEAGSSQAEVRAAGEQALEKATAKMEKLADIYRTRKEEFTEADGKLEKLKAEQAEHDSVLKALKKENEQATKTLRIAEQDRKKLLNKRKAFDDGRARAAQFVSKLQEDYPWILQEKQFFNRTGSDYDFAAKDPVAQKARRKELQEEQATLSKKINKKVMGMIEKAETEYKELVRKKQVIEDDKKKIYKVINELDQKKQQALQTTWLKVNRDFGSIFSTLLPGTSAKLQPPEGSTVTEGLEVKVAFGNVWKESLTELSGGQRSLLALSLILSLLRFKPAPMYILDEVDAALDLSHTQNIGTMLKTHFSASQFIVVSLKEGMFNNANVIFRTKFVDGISAVGRTTNRSAALPAPAAATGTDEPAAGSSKGRKRGNTGGRNGSENAHGASVGVS